MSLEVLHLLLVLVEDETHGVGDIIQVVNVSATIGENLAGAVITSDDDIATVGVNDVVSSLGCIAGVLHLMGALDGGRRGHEAGIGCALTQEASGLGLSSCQINIASHCLHRRHHDSGKE